LLTRSRLEKAGLDRDTAEEWAARRDLLSNLQLLDGVANQEKSNHPPATWMSTHPGSNEARERYADQHLLGDIPAEPSDFGHFYDDRRERLRNRLHDLLTSKA
jgi:hypothetical protein